MDQSNSYTSSLVGPVFEDQPLNQKIMTTNHITGQPLTLVSHGGGTGEILVWNGDPSFDLNNASTNTQDNPVYKSVPYSATMFGM